MVHLRQFEAPRGVRQVNGAPLLQESLRTYCSILYTGPVGYLSLFETANRAETFQSQDATKKFDGANLTLTQ